MIFVLAGDNESLFILLSEKDLPVLRQGNTKFVDHHQIGAKTFKRVVFSLSPSDQDSLEMLKKAGHAHLAMNLVHPEPEKAEARCDGCKGIMLHSSLQEGKCICCWRDEAKKLRVAAN